jgi:hypothetical protein
MIYFKIVLTRHGKGNKIIIFGFGVIYVDILPARIKYHPRLTHRTLGSNALWGQNREIDPKVRSYATYQRTLGSRGLKVSSEFCLNTEY